MDIIKKLNNFFFKSFDHHKKISIFFLCGADLIIFFFVINMFFGSSKIKIDGFMLEAVNELGLTVLFSVSALGVSIFSLDIKTKKGNIEKKEYIFSYIGEVFQLLSILTFYRLVIILLDVISNSKFEILKTWVNYNTFFVKLIFLGGLFLFTLTIASLIKIIQELYFSNKDK